MTDCNSCTTMMYTDSEKKELANSLGDMRLQYRKKRRSSSRKRSASRRRRSISRRRRRRSRSTRRRRSRKLRSCVRKSVRRCVRRSGLSLRRRSGKARHVSLKHLKKILHRLRSRSGKRSRSKGRLVNPKTGRVVKRRSALGKKLIALGH